MKALDPRENAGTVVYAERELRHRVVKSLAWQSWASLAGQTISWIASLFVIRLLQPSDYGLMASAVVLLGFLTVVSELGLGAAAVQASVLPRRHLRELQALLLLLGACGGLVMAASGGLLVWFYGEPRLDELACGLALTLPLTALYVLPQSMAAREMRFDRKATADLGAALIAAGLTLTLAMLGAGVWTLVVGSVAMHASRVLIYAALQRGLLMPSFSLRRTRRFLRFGLMLSADRLLWFLLCSVDVLILGKRFGEETLGLYVVALTLASLPLEKIAPIVTQVSFPAFAQIQRDALQVRRSVLASVHYGALVFVPIAWGGALIGPDALPLLLGEKWREIVLPFQLLCVVLPLRALNALISPALMGTGRVRTNIVNLVVSLALMAPAYLIGSAYGLPGMALAWLLVYPVVFLATTIRSTRVLGLPLGQVIRASRTAVVGGLVLAAAVLLVRSQLPASPILALALAIPTGALTYLAVVRLLEPSLIGELRSLRPSSAHAD